VRELVAYGANVHVHDPLASTDECEHEYGVKLTPWDKLPAAQAVVAAVSHKEYFEMGLPKLASKLVPKGVFIDVKSSFKLADISDLGFSAWRL
jgi:UDP-N-acetyl-D-galactosamine dehydrogenase